MKSPKNFPSSVHNHTVRSVLPHHPEFGISDEQLKLMLSDEPSEEKPIKLIQVVRDHLLSKGWAISLDPSISPNDLYFISPRSKSKMTLDWISAAIMETEYEYQREEEATTV